MALSELRPKRRRFSRFDSRRLPFSKPIRPLLQGQWRPGMPCHWVEQTPHVVNRFLLVRFLACLQIISGIAYLLFRFNETIAIFSNAAWYRVYQVSFFVCEVISFISIAMRFLESWMVTRRNCVDFKRLPLELIAANPSAARSGKENTHPEIASYPSVAVFIPCYNEDVDLVHDTIIAALNMDYPAQLLSIYLCDDGQDPSKRSMLTHLQHRHSNLHYVTRPTHTHAKAGNLNYSLERTNSDLVVILDADFIARPNLLQRLIPYYYVWNPLSGMYEFNHDVAAVQAPQQFRNLSPFDPDPTDQRATFFMEVVLPAKDYFNGAPLIGTTNLINRSALQKAGYFPYHSVTEDTALSIVFHSLGLKTYYVNESLASGLATTSLWSNFDQRERWLQGDWQILFSKRGPLTVKGLTLSQRLMYLNMSWNRLISIVHLLYDFSSVALLVFGLTMVDVPNTWRFIQFLGPYVLLGVMVRFVRTVGKDGYGKSESGAVAFEVMFRFVTLKGLFIALLKGQKIKFNVTDKSSGPSKEQIAKGVRLCERDWVKNLRRAWFNIMMAVMLGFSIAYCIARPPSFRLNKTSMGYEDGSVLPITMALGFAAANLLPHLLAVYLCFIPLVSGWVMQDVVHGRCDQYAVDPITGKRYVPPSFITMLNVLQLVLIFGSMMALSVFTLRVNEQYGTFIPI